MAERGRYKTKHHDSVLTLLTEKSGQCMSVDDISAELTKRGVKIERTTVYRQLEKLAADGDAVKYISEKGSSAVYTLREKDATPHLHLKCLDCGGLTHLDCSEAETFMRHLREEHSFIISRSNTIIYGHCGCLARRAEIEHEV